MGRKLPERFISPSPGDDQVCEECDKRRATCRYCDRCYEHCHCPICDVCGGDKNAGLCNCFNCPDCWKTFSLDDSVFDNGKYDEPGITSRDNYVHVCSKCYKKRAKKWERETGRKAASIF